MRIPLMVAKYRAAHRLTQRELGEKIGTSQSWVSLVEKGAVSLNEMRPEHRGALLGLLGYQAKLHRRSDSGETTVISHPSEKEAPVGFQLFKRERKAVAEGEIVARIAPSGTITLSKALCEMFDIKKRGRRYELFWSPETRQIGIKILKPEEKTPDSRSMAMIKPGSTGLVDASDFLAEFRLMAPGESFRVEPKVEGDMIIIDYPKMLVGGNR